MTTVLRRTCLKFNPAGVSDSAARCDSGNLRLETPSRAALWPGAGLSELGTPCCGAAVKAAAVAALPSRAGGPRRGLYAENGVDNGTRGKPRPTSGRKKARSRLFVVEGPRPKTDRIGRRWSGDRGGSRCLVSPRNLPVCGGLVVTRSLGARIPSSAPPIGQRQSATLLPSGLTVIASISARSRSCRETYDL